MISKINSRAQSSMAFFYEGEYILYDVVIEYEQCCCTEIPGTVITQSNTILDDEFDYNMTTTAILNVLYG